MEDSFRALGVDEFFAKPFNTDSLLTALRKFAHTSSPVKAAPSQETRVKQLADAKRIAESAPLRTKRALIFGYDNNAANSMASDLKKRGYAITLIDHETDIAEYTAAISFDLVIVQLYMQEEEPLDQVIRSVREQTEARRKKLSNFDIEEIPVVIYKIPTETQAGLGDEVADIDSLLDRCTDFDRVQYIGDYTPISFLTKLKDLL
jgi:ActR/RegA family two-component response regulator